MDISIIHAEAYRHLRQEIGARGWVSLAASTLDAVVPIAFAGMMWQSDPLIAIFGAIATCLVCAFKQFFLA